MAIKCSVATMPMMALPEILGHCNGSVGPWSNVEQSELGRRDPVGAIPAEQGTVPAATTKAVCPLQGAVSYRHTVKQLLKSVVRQIRMLPWRGQGISQGEIAPDTASWRCASENQSLVNSGEGDCGRSADNIIPSLP